ncbi:MAG TPA: type II toxin-antitoxin system PrlF family antitoxin [Thermoanaerobaculia bacterium]|nr:type II toxin-antitoxin system PrlF family antitoxin [Thermoanaerobaculia bacterium]
MATATITRRGQITLPRSVREHLRVAEGDRLDFVIRENGSVILVPIGGSLRRLSGLLARSGSRPASIEELHDSIAAFHSEENARIRRQG